MQPELTDYLLQTAQKMAMDLAGKQTDDYDAATLRIYAFLNMIGAAEHDRGADIRAWENKAMRDLFGRAADLVADAPLSQRLKEAAASEDKSLRISDLNEAGDQLRALLIDLQAMLEGATVPALTDLHRDTWRYLAEATRRRALPLMPM